MLSNQLNLLDFSNEIMPGTMDQATFMSTMWKREEEEFEKLLTLGKQEGPNVLEAQQEKLHVTDIVRIKYSFKSGDTVNSHLKYAIRRIEKAHVRKKYFIGTSHEELRNRIEEDCSDRQVQVKVTRVSEPVSKELLQCILMDRSGKFDEYGPCEIRVTDKFSGAQYSVCGFLDLDAPLNLKVKDKEVRKKRGNASSCFRTIVNPAMFVAELLFFKQIRAFTLKNLDRVEEIVLKDVQAQLQGDIYFKPSKNLKDFEKRLEMSNYPYDIIADEFISANILRALSPSSIYPSRTLLEQMGYRSSSSALAETYVETRHYNPIVVGLAVDIFVANVDFAESVTMYEKKISDSERSYAAFFQTKQNIPEKIQQQMKKSLLKEWFTYVEYDELCDLGEVGKFESEVINFLQESLTEEQQQKLGLWNFRVRRLGKHKAEGLVGPAVRCMAIDYRYPRAFVHELHHVLDFSYECRSLELDFDRLHSMYVKDLDLFVSGLPDEDPFKVQYYSNRKYNRAYYTSRVEAFAYLGDVYFQRRLKESSLTSTKEYISQALSEDTLTELDFYFDCFYEV